LIAGRTAKRVEIIKLSVVYLRAKKQ